jgi:anti-sigma regulatory factor (Ser/Thr protein kinase)
VGQPGDFVFRSWPAKPEQLAAVRSEAHAWLATLGLPERSREDLVLAISEAATNAIVHGYRSSAPGTVDVTFWTEPDALCVEVADAGWTGPSNGDGILTGMGISIMRRLVESVLIRFEPSGTRVLLRHPLATEEVAG